MALLFTESFGPYATLTDFATYGITHTNAYSTDSIDSTGGYNSAPAYKVVATNTDLYSTLVYPLGFAPASNELRFGFWWKITAGALGSTVNYAGFPSTICFLDSTLTKWMALRLSSTGVVGWANLKTGNNAACDYVGSGATIADGQHHWVEGRVILGGASNGTVQVWVDGVLEINQTSVTNDGGTGLTCTSMTRVQMGAFMHTSSATQWLSHVMVWDTGGSAFTGYLGPSRIEYLTPNAAGSNSALTPTSGANYTNVNEQVANLDTNYVEGATSGLIDTYNYTALAATPASIKAVMVKSFAKNADVGTRNFRAKCLSSATYADGADQALSVAYKTFSEIYYTDPATSAAWTASGIAAAEFGVEVRT